MTAQNTESVLIRPGEGAPVVGLDMLHKVRGNRVQSGLLIMEGTIAPRRSIPSHTHSREDECSYILSGELMFQVGDETLTAGSGCYVIKPRDVPHAFWNLGDTPARVMEIHVPGTFDHFYDDLAATMNPDMTEQQRHAAQATLHVQYGLTFHWDRTRQLATRYDLQS